MDISKLTIQGFKSFYEKSVFTFGSNITAIVGPNGSGKSNITEAIRFVLGEQSTKSMRGKDITDLLFRGNSTRASKAYVQIEFVKSKKQEIVQRGNVENIFIKNALEKDEVTVSRTIYADGKSEYAMNGVEVRVKDLHEFLLYIHLGNKSSWHISQGEADRVLQSNSAERKTIVEDALGLKVYHARIKDSEKKLDKTKENIREATIRRKEIMPELSALARQVERIKRGVEFRTDLENKALIFLNYKKQKIENLNKENLSGNQEDNDIKLLQDSLNKIELDILEKEKKQYKNSSHDTGYLERELEKEEKVLEIVKDEFVNFENKKRDTDNNLSYLNLEENKNFSEFTEVESEIKNIAAQGNDIIFSEKNINETRNVIEANTDKILNSNDIQNIKHIAQETDFTYKKLLSVGSVVSKDNVKQISYLQNIKFRLQEKLQKIKNDKQKYEEDLIGLSKNLDNSKLKLNLVNERIESIKKQILEFKYLKVESEREVQQLIFDRTGLQMKITKLQEFMNRISEMQKDLESDSLEFKSILGIDLLSSSKKVEEITSEEEFQSLKRSIERLKIRLEESQVANPDEVVKNFENMTEQDNFLLKEIEDLEKSTVNLEKLILDLKTSLKQEFEFGLEHINKVFDSYVKRLFGGGSAKVFVVEIENRKSSLKSVDEDLDSEVEEDAGEAKTGIEVEVEIPKKKVKGLHSLSGGERALVSIALNFSIINQNPAPFMILDETDAALDEANSKRYGEILEMLKSNTKLIVVTHNRETMHFADQVYGVTLGKEGHSKVLSVSFEEAVEYAK